MSYVLHCVENDYVDIISFQPKLADRFRDAPNVKRVIKHDLMEIPYYFCCWQSGCCDKQDEYILTEIFAESERLKELPTDGHFTTPIAVAMFFENLKTKYYKVLQKLSKFLKKIS